MKAAFRVHILHLHLHLIDLRSFFYYNLREIRGASIFALWCFFPPVWRPFDVQIFDVIYVSPRMGDGDGGKKSGNGKYFTIEGEKEGGGEGGCRNEPLEVFRSLCKCRR